MFDKTYFEQHVNIKPTCSGVLQKSCPESQFVRFHIRSEMAGCFFTTSTPSYNRRDVSVLQIMLFGDEQCMIEFVYKDLIKSEGEQSN